MDSETKKLVSLLSRCEVTSEGEVVRLHLKRHGKVFLRSQLFDASGTSKNNALWCGALHAIQ